MAQFGRFTLFIQQNVAMNSFMTVPLTIERRKKRLFKWARAWEFSVLNSEFEM